MKAVTAEILVGTSQETEKHKVAVHVQLTQNDPVYGDLSATERDTVLAAMIAAVRDSLPDYHAPATVTSEETASA
ncbi:hypothetical protein LHJ74_28070 [Streptomyces sp. N2-109]|uniref:Uncharacterized protein n=1 Tax=Streptomyces gossypii TaxID=2883101 RepID=A0ABT2K024_9ACTN|nr:hypothetical protein [Streptomyces gossypii]MCT2592984.1 hypothetical protein [Streptomyces gossypii]MCT2593717.1 hypothetical protein [Streptomyces gossypii]